MIDFFSVLNRRRSVRAYREAQLQEDALQTILEAGRTAPSGGNSCSTHMLVLQNPDILEKLRALVEQEFSKMEVDEQTYPSIRNSVNASKKGGYAFFYHAPTLIVTANRIGYGNAMADTACVLENMMLAATALGVGSCWINQLRWLNGNEAIRAFLSPLGLGADEIVCGGLALGYPADESVFKAVQRGGNPVTYVR